MLELDEYNQRLVAKRFADDSSSVSSSCSHDILPLYSSSVQHPLRSRSISPVRRYNTPGIPSVTVADHGDETRPGLKRVPSLDRSSTEEDRTTGGASEAPRGRDSIIIHPVGPHDSFAGVALRYGVSIAALRRANQLWPADPIHLRTELLIPRGNVLRARHKSNHGQSTNAALRSAVESTPDLSSDVVTSSLVAVRNMMLSVLPARISLDSLSSKASVSEDHELEDLQTARRRQTSAVEAPFNEDGHELSLLSTSRASYKHSSVSLSSQVSYSSTNNHRMDPNHIIPVGDLRSRSISSSHTASFERLPRTQPFAVLPVRTSQLEPEPAMELPVRRSRV